MVSNFTIPQARIKYTTAATKIDGSNTERTTSPVSGLETLNILSNGAVSMPVRLYTKSTNPLVGFAPNTFNTNLKPSNISISPKMYHTTFDTVVLLSDATSVLTLRVF